MLKLFDDSGNNWCALSVVVIELYPDCHNNKQQRWSCSTKSPNLRKYGLIIHKHLRHLDAASAK